MEKMIEAPWAVPVDEVLAALRVARGTGLSEAELAVRLQQYGRNQLRQVRNKSPWQILLNQFKSLIIVLLGAAGGISFLFGDWLEGLAIIAVIVINAAIGFFTELKAVRSMEALRRLGSVKTRVRRDGRELNVPAHSLVPGDIVLLEGGDVVTADLRLIAASRLQADESTLTGESFPVMKNVALLSEGVPLAERTNMLFKGTAVTRGSGEGVVVATGMATELGCISSLVAEAEDETTPLERRLDQLGHRLIWATLAITAAIGLAGYIKGREFLVTLETSIALAVAAIPEGLPIVATLALAKGMHRMAKRNALINRLSSVETLGAATVIFTDKTGTLTENRMTVARMVIAGNEIHFDEQAGFVLDGKPLQANDQPLLTCALRVAVLCNNASYEKKAEKGPPRATGDPLEVALLAAGAFAGLHKKELVEQLPEVREEAFDSESKMMATFHKDDAGILVVVKGAPETVLAASARVFDEGGETALTETVRTELLEQANRLAGEGLRVLALAQKKEAWAEALPYENLSFIGLVGLHDPPRADIREALDRTRDAGIKVIMVTGDLAVTAQHIACSVGLVRHANAEVIHGGDLRPPEELAEDDRRHLLGVSLFARVSPKQKLDLIAFYQAGGEVVAMTGDGVNDAPALKKADIGIAMGRRGTQVAREAADMVLTDDAFSSIVVAIEGGRVIFNNIRKFVIYLLSCNISEILVVSIATLLNAPLPILPLQILFLNLVTDVFPALALGLGKGDSAVMRQPPRAPQEAIINRSHWLIMSGYGLLISLSVLGALAMALFRLGMTEQEAVSVSFLTLAFAQLWHVFNMRNRGSQFFKNDITMNPYVWGALALCTLLLLAAVYLPGLAGVLSLADPGPEGWLLVLMMSLVTWSVGQLLNSFGKRAENDDRSGPDS
jgi:Ca2+-transporting ATPase